MTLLVIIGIIAVVIIFVIMITKSGKKEQNPQTCSITPKTTPKEPSNEELIANAKKLAAMGEALQQAKAHGDDKTVQEILNMTYTGPLPEQKEDGSYTQIYKNYLRFKIAGINHRDGIGDYEGKFMGEVVPEPTNQYDPNAIKIVHQDGKHLGYVPAEDTQQLREWVQNKFPFKCYGEIFQDEDYDEERKYYWGEVMVEEPE
ncbi:MAG: HIRAN domain-containing protein [Bacteroidaceae bacterium]|nr:HIRAN domain-containing protein [Bacteroidaceae bacterium]